MPRPIATGSHSIQRPRSASSWPRIQVRAPVISPRLTGQARSPTYGALFRPNCGQIRACPESMTVVTRFAPSPTGYLHIGGARTALFNWLFAKHHGGKYLLRIEDTDRARSTQPAIEAIVDGLSWLGLGWAGEVDDQDMGVTHVIRGDDHLNNAFRQLQIIKAMGWPEPVYAHIPLIHGSDGAKLSKRHGALGVDAYRDMGFLPAALRNYLLRLGWGHGDDEIISTKQAIEWFDLPGVGRAPSRFDTVKLTNLNAHYLREAPDAELLPLVLPRIVAKAGGKIEPVGLQRIERGMDGVKQR